MLVLTRKLGQTIDIDGVVEIEIVQVRGKQVRLALNMKKDFPVFRGEMTKEEREDFQKRWTGGREQRK